MDEVLNESYAIWDKPSPASLPFSRQLDGMLPGCVYYPEEEWGTFNYRPPEHSDLLGAWRTQRGDAFVFLLSFHRKQVEADTPDYRVLVAGRGDVVRSIGKQIVAHKGVLERVQRRELATKKADENFTEEVNTKSLQRFTAIVAVFAAIVNAFSLYLRNLPVPDFANETLLVTYRWLIVAVHFGALALLLLIVAIAFAYLLKFGLLLVRRRK